VFKELTHLAVVSHGSGDQNSAKFGAAINLLVQSISQKIPGKQMNLACVQGWCHGAATPTDAA
jgi:hypothetical protein